MVLPAISRGCWPHKLAGRILGRTGLIDALADAIARLSLLAADHADREAVAEDRLIDHEPPIRYQTLLTTQGIHFDKGQNVEALNLATGEIEVFGQTLNTPNVVAQCRGCLDRAGSARYRPNGRP